MLQNRPLTVNNALKRGTAGTGCTSSEVGDDWVTVPKKKKGSTGGKGNKKGGGKKKSWDTWAAPVAAMSAEAVAARYVFRLVCVIVHA
jgi:hypothetical protein